ncbi:MAG: prephenate dehydrogenase/arogenate dehydrogenase family protein [Rubrobacteraceae bacterium]|uniref:prephenate dehydrogenase/arogenate dehydrogenase family protein n=1 Tax=Rubrobacter naiadicus TaxID=1392641 RepID=UPI00235ED7D2|nr:prephenate dehydrogenase/arogenate dehydrogenase family protein [Rubrobacter naiadicus]MBX6763878.1 prephenate dehydrogenase/arogenate dehydrogenase family protein [Rubrobacteraceae bacterium]
MRRTLAVVGVGLIGGSIGLAARSRGDWEVIGVDRPGVLEKAAALGAIDRPSTLKEARGADLVVLAAPISQIVTLLKDLSPTRALMTDVASTKAGIVREAERLGLRFVGGHPMNGSQLSGVDNARADLFEGARYFLTPTERTDPDDYREVSGFVRSLGATPTAVEADKHDLLMAALSHLPHLMAVALLRVASDISPEALSFAGPSFRDLTRVGSSNPSLWADILAENAPALGEVLGRFAGAMAQIGSEISNREIIERRFREAREAYEALGGILIEKGGKNVEISVPVENRPGVFAEVTTLLGRNNINILDLYLRHSNTSRAALVLTLDSKAAPLARRLLEEAGFTVETED